ncbi:MULTISPECIES: hypothetical protein [unclassified Streptomyces]|uniref:hypothetical protein n=1 Tax=unclassified Streptomyces TaxID=2593676 RepID=UPI00093D523A|nr:hypothetical protein [Streptomyces sp. TSRI0281]OKI40171.1 hypothetical protein A6A29_39920 [Streptomyces sp. TSRI0281]
MKLTAAGKTTAAQLTAMEQFQSLVQRCRAMQGNLADMSGTDLKNLIYDLFPDEVGNATFHQEIRP